MKRYTLQAKKWLRENKADSELIILLRKYLYKYEDANCLRAVERKVKSLLSEK